MKSFSAVIKINRTKTICVVTREARTMTGARVRVAQRVYLFMGRVVVRSSARMEDKDLMIRIISIVCNVYLSMSRFGSKGGTVFRINLCNGFDVRGITTWRMASRSNGFRSCTHTLVRQSELYQLDFLLIFLFGLYKDYFVCTQFLYLRKEGRGATAH